MMKKFMLGCACFLMALGLVSGEANALDDAILDFSKVKGGVYVGEQSVPLYPFMSDVPGPYLTVNFFVVVSEDKSEIVLIDAPVVLGNVGEPPVVDLLTPFLEILATDFPGAEIKAVLLTHDHIDHVSGSIMYFMANSIPVYASIAELDAVPGIYDFETWTGYPLKTFAVGIEPGFGLPFDKGLLKAIDLRGHSAGHLGYAYLPDGDKGKINWLFAGDALLGPPEDYFKDPADITYCFRLNVLNTDTDDFVAWGERLGSLRDLLTRRAKLFPAHGAVKNGQYWLGPRDYIDYTMKSLFDPDLTPCLPPGPQ